MKTSLKRTIGIAMFGLAALCGGPASAGGSLNMMITLPSHAAEAIAHGLRDRHKGKNRARISQNGENNAAAIAQHGAGNYAGVMQHGRDHTATISQHGYNNTLGVIQFGKTTNLDFAQRGNGQGALVIQGGW